MSDPILVHEWSAEAFHRHVLELETAGYVTRRETYRISPEMNPDTGEVVHLRTIEMVPSLENDNIRIDALGTSEV